MELVIVLLLAGLLGYVIGRENALGRVRDWYASRRKGGADEKEDNVPEAA